MTRVPSLSWFVVSPEQSSPNVNIDHFLAHCGEGVYCYSEHFSRHHTATH